MSSRRKDIGGERGLKKKKGGKDIAGGNIGRRKSEKTLCGKTCPSRVTIDIPVETFLNRNWRNGKPGRKEGSCEVRKNAGLRLKGELHSLTLVSRIWTLRRVKSIEKGGKRNLTERKENDSRRGGRKASRIGGRQKRGGAHKKKNCS